MRILLKTTFKFKESLTLLNNEKLGIDDYENFKEYQKLEKAAKISKQKKRRREKVCFSS
jgi:hypothetical protein